MEQLSRRLESPAGNQPHLVHHVALTGSMDTNARSLISYKQPIGKASALKAWGAHLVVPSQVVDGGQCQPPYWRYMPPTGKEIATYLVKCGGPTW